MIGYIKISPEDLHKYVNEDTLVAIDYDQIAFQGASALEKKKIQVTSKASGNTMEFKNRTEFWGQGKKIGGWLGERNKLQEEAGKKIFEKEEFEVLDIQIPAENIAHTFQAAKSKLTGVVEHLKLKKYMGVIGIGKTFRHKFQMPKEYKSERSEMKPLQLAETKDYLVNQHHGDVVIDIEADDALEIIGYKGFLDYKETGKFSSIVASIDKDSLSTPSLLFNFYRDSGCTEYKTPEIILIDDSIGDIWIQEKVNSKGKVTKEVKGWGSYWLAYQMLFGDSTDTIRPYQDFDIKFGEIACYNLISPCKTQYELFSKVKEQFNDWFPEGVEFISWTGEDIKITADAWLETIFQLVYMKRTNNDQTTFESMLENFKNSVEED